MHIHFHSNFHEFNFGTKESTKGDGGPEVARKKQNTLNTPTKKKKPDPRGES